MPKLNEFTQNKSTPPVEYTTWKSDPSEENYKNLMDKLTPIVNSGLTSFGSPNLKIRSRILVDKALRSYDPSQGASLNTHVYNNLKGLQRYKAKRSAATHTPERVRLDKFHINKFETDYHNVHKVIPSDQTIADHLMLSRARIAKARSGSGESPELFSDKGDQITEGKSRSAYDIWMDYVHHDLDDVNKKVLEWTTGYGGSDVLKKSEIAKRLGISGPAVSSRINTIQKKLEEGTDDGTRDLR